MSQPTHKGLGGLAHLKHNPRFLKQVLGGYGTRDHAPGVRKHSQLTWAVSRQDVGGGGSERLCQDMEYVARPLEAPSLSHSPFQKDLHKLPKAAGVVIPDSFGITEGLQEGCCLQDLDPKRRCGTCSGGLEWGTWGGPPQDFPDTDLPKNSLCEGETRGGLPIEPWGLPTVPQCSHLMLFNSYTQTQLPLNQLQPFTRQPRARTGL